MTEEWIPLVSFLGVGVVGFIVFLVCVIFSLIKENDELKVRHVNWSRYSEGWTIAVKQKERTHEEWRTEAILRTKHLLIWLESGGHWNRPIYMEKPK